MAKLNLVSPDILEQVYLFKTNLEKDPRFNLFKKRKAYHALDLEADRHSVELEFPFGKKLRKGRSKQIALRNIDLAQSYLKDLYKGEITQEKMRATAAFILGEEGDKDYRDCSARTMDKAGEFFVYPDSLEVPEEMTRFASENNSLECDVEKAVHAHFHISRIHPFDDGNGRLARLLQNVILDECGFPPAVISKNERGIYLDLISDAARSYRDYQGQLKPEQSRFYNFLAMKVVDSLSDVVRKLE